MTIIPKYYLHTYRKGTFLTLSDIAFLNNSSDYSNLSRFEKGLREPNIPILLMYHLLFNIPIEQFFGRQKEVTTQILKQRIPVLIENIRASERPDFKDFERIDFLGKVLTRLNSSQSHE